MTRTEKRYGLCYLSACLGTFSNDLLTGCEAADRLMPASFSSAMKRYGLRLRFALFSALNAKCVRCKACGTAVLLIAFCVILRLRPFLRLTCLGAFSNDLLTGCEAADRLMPASFSSAMKRYGLRLRFALFSALNAKCVRCKACGTAVLLIAFCVILRLRRDMLFISSNAVRCRVFIRVLHVGFGFPLLRGSDVNLWRTQGLRIIFDTLIMSILYFYGDVKLIFKKGTVLL